MLSLRRFEFCRTCLSSLKVNVKDFVVEHYDKIQFSWQLVFSRNVFSLINMSSISDASWHRSRKILAQRIINLRYHIQCSASFKQLRCNLNIQLTAWSLSLGKVGYMISIFVCFFNVSSVFDFDFQISRCRFRYFIISLWHENKPTMDARVTAQDGA